nr:hypothetical protein [Spelaeicoccus albus]
MHGGFDRFLSVQRPVVLADIRRVRRRHPDSSPAEIIALLERRYLTAMIGGGAAVGASAVVPGVGTGVSLALSGVETAGFLEASALFAQAVTEIHGIAVTEPGRAHALVMTMMLGGSGTKMVRQFAAHAAGTGPSVMSQWGPMVTSSLPRAAVSKLTAKLRRTFVKRFAVQQGAGVVGRVLPFGIGAAIGGFGNRVMGKRVIASARYAFGPAPEFFPPELADPFKRPKTLKQGGPVKQLRTRLRLHR